MATIKVYFDKELDVAEYKVEGTLTYQELHDAIDQYYKGTLTKYTMWDFTETDAEKFWKNEVRQIVNQVDSALKARKNCYDLIVVPGLIQFGVAMIYESYIELIHKRTDDVKTMVFRSREDAYAWIRGK